MRLKGSLLVALALVLIGAPFAQAQFPPPVRVPGVPHTGASITNRVDATGIFVSTPGTQVGKITIVSALRDGKPVQGLKLRAQLSPSTEYTLVIDNVVIGTGTTNATGTLKMAFASPSNGRVPALPEAVGIATNARVASLVQVSGQRPVAAAQLSSRGGSTPR